jgi:hypothetical protein
MAGLFEYANAMNPGSAYSNKIDAAVNEAMGNIQTNVKPCEEFGNCARPMNDVEKAFRKEMIGHEAGRIDGYKDPIDPRVMEKIDDMISKGGKIHPAIQEQYNQVMANPAKFGLEVEKNNFIERKMGQGNYDFKPM